MLPTCLTDAGFPVVMDADGRGWSFRAPAGQDEAFARAEFECHARYPREPKYYQPYILAQLRAWYQHLAGHTIACLARQGYEVTEQPPSEDVWVAGYVDGAAGLWNPFFDSAVPHGAVDSVMDTCPVRPDDFFELATPVD